MAEATAGSRADGHRVLACGLGNLPIHFAFYSGGIYTIETDDPTVLAAHLDQDAEVFAVINADLIDQLPEGVRQRMVRLESTRLNRRDVLLVANRPPG